MCVVSDKIMNAGSITALLIDCPTLLYGLNDKESVAHRIASQRHAVCLYVSWRVALLWSRSGRAYYVVSMEIVNQFTHRHIP